MRILKAIIIGALAGAALFFLPFFILRGFLFILFAGVIFRLIIGSRFRHGGFRGRGFNPAFADSIRNMSDEEYNHFKQKMNRGWGRNNWKNNMPGNETTNEKQSS